MTREAVKNEHGGNSPNGKVIKDEDKGRTPSKSSVRKAVHFQDGSADKRPSKRMKIDHEEQVNELFAAEIKNEKSFD